MVELCGVRPGHVHGMLQSRWMNRYETGGDVDELRHVAGGRSRRGAISVEGLRTVLADLAHVLSRGACLVRRDRVPFSVCCLTRIFN